MVDSDRAGRSLWTPGTVRQDAEFAPRLVVLPPGEFLMGSPPDDPDADDDEFPRHRVVIAHTVALGTHPVTVREYARFLQETGHDHRPADPEKGPALHPVRGVSWQDAQCYLRWLSERTGCPYRLPSEAEWEYAVRAGTTTRYPWGDQPDPALPPNGNDAADGFGLHDMHGAVWQWCEDCWNEDYDGAPADGTAWVDGDCGYRVVRGGPWQGKPWMRRSAFRSYFVPELRHDDGGFRVARTVIASATDDRP